METPESPPGALDYMQVIVRKRWLIVGVVAATLAAVLAWSFAQTPRYTAAAEILATTPDISNVLDNAALQNRTDVRSVERRIDTQLRLFQTSEVADLAARELGLASGRDITADVSAQVAGTSDIIIVQATADSPNTAAETANAMATAFVLFQARNSVETLETVINEISAAVDVAQGEFDALDAEMTELIADDDTAQALALQSRRDAALDELSQQKQRLNDLEVQARLQQQFASIVEPAIPPDSPSSPKIARNALLALFLGAMLGVAVAFAVEYLDDSVRSTEQLEKATRVPVLGTNVPVLGTIPNFSTKTRRMRLRKRVVAGKPELVSASSPAADAYRRLQVNLEFVSLDHPLGILGVTSARPSEGKTTTTANLAASIARSDKRVILVGGDLRKPSLHTAVGVGNSDGLSEVLRGERSLAEVLVPIQVDGSETQVWLLPTGGSVPNPAELVGSRRMAELMGELCERSDIVLVDMPPVMTVADAPILAAQCDGVLLLGREGVSKVTDIARAHDTLRKVGARVVGGVLNAVSQRRGQTGYYYYGDYYDSAEPTEAQDGSVASRPQATRRKPAAKPKQPKLVSRPQSDGARI